MDPMTMAAVVSALVRVAPELAGWIGGRKAGAVAQTAVDIAKQVTGVPDAGQAASKLHADPDLAARYRAELAQREADLQAAQLLDVQDARSRDVQLRRAGDGSNLRADLLAYLAVGLLYILIITLFIRPLADGAARDALMILVGVVGTIVTQVYAFEFGSSRGSKDKSGLLGRWAGGGR